MIIKYDIIDANNMRVNSRHLQMVDFCIYISVYMAKLLFVIDGFIILNRIRRKIT